MKKNKIPFKSKLASIKDIKERNKAFENLSDEQKRKEIAYDGLMLILLGIISGSGGAYWSFRLKCIKNDSKSSNALQRNLLKKEKIEGCFVCQRGLMMLSQIRLGNSINPYDYGVENGSDDIVKGFTMDDFHNMEAVFEGWDNANGKISKYPYQAGSNERAANICCNVIANGKFKRSDRTNYLKKWNIEIPKEPKETL